MAESKIKSNGLNALSVIRPFETEAKTITNNDDALFIIDISLDGYIPCGILQIDTNTSRCFIERYKYNGGVLSVVAYNMTGANQSIKITVQVRYIKDLSA
jgi:hypothetical protein